MRILVDTNVILDWLITRNVSDFQNSIVPAMLPEEFLTLYFSEK